MYRHRSGSASCPSGDLWYPPWIIWRDRILECPTESEELGLRTGGRYPRDRHYCRAGDHRGESRSRYYPWCSDHEFSFTRICLGCHHNTVCQSRWDSTHHDAWDRSDDISDRGRVSGTSEDTEPEAVRRTEWWSQAGILYYRCYHDRWTDSDESDRFCWIPTPTHSVECIRPIQWVQYDPIDPLDTRQACDLDHPWATDPPQGCRVSRSSRDTYGDRRCRTESYHGDPHRSWTDHRIRDFLLWSIWSHGDSRRDASRELYPTDREYRLDTWYPAW
jgi:hypothetical protein